MVEYCLLAPASITHCGVVVGLEGRTEMVLIEISSKDGWDRCRSNWGQDRKIKRDKGIIASDGHLILHPITIGLENWYGQKTLVHTFVLRPDVASAAAPIPMNGPHRESLLVNFISTRVFDPLFDRFVIRKESDVQSINSWNKMIEVVERINSDKIIICVKVLGRFFVVKMDGEKWPKTLSSSLLLWFKSIVLNCLMSERGIVNSSDNGLLAMRIFVIPPMRSTYCWQNWIVGDWQGSMRT